ncbi:BON domain-containing protein [Ramlibacter alkalitolerans]|uniref:BON domain-containing protein n=1 Tax=Ramlibacter alkalitolerans TaxID=2039631 RepID=A0ABS1JPM1_9BURK|nr:BON domain-containing protein [Ramlibacter alkalitolerans]MBL0426219.1 BON domain-containing protein [Ramlibacter alkalitolerans]
MRPLGTLGAVAAGALAMYYLDPELGAQRRRLLAELVRSGLPQERRQARQRTRAYHRVTQADPQSDADLRDQIQTRLGRLVSHPDTIDVSVDNGVVRLGGRVLSKERDGLLEQVQQMRGVQKLVNAMASVDDPQDMGRRPGRAASAEEPAAPGEPQPVR